MGDRNFTRGASNETAGTGPTTFTARRRSVYALDAPRLTISPHTDDDGEKETRVLEEYIKQTDSSPRGDSRSPRGRRGSRLGEGDAIEARYRGRSKYYKGKISRVRADGTRVAVSNSAYTVS